MTLRSEIGQAAWVASRFRRPRRWAALLRSARGLNLPPLPRTPRGRGTIWATMMAKNEIDILPLVIDHTLAQGIDHILVVDNGSTDGTAEFLRERAAKDDRLHVGTDTEPTHHQSEKTSLLAHHSWRNGADWIVPIDADEFWFASDGRTVGQLLRNCTYAIAFASWHHMIPTAPTLGLDTEFQLSPTPDPTGKAAVRSHPLLEIHSGNHNATRVGPQGAPGLCVAHAIYRSRDQLARKLRQGAAALAGAGPAIRGANRRWLSGERLTDADFDDIWTHLSTGLPDPRIDWVLPAPPILTQPLRWTSWDPHGQLTEAT